MFKKDSRYTDDNGVVWVSVRDMRFDPTVNPWGWVKETDIMREEGRSVFSLEQLHDLVLLRDVFGVELALEPEQTYDISLEVNLAPIPDGKEWRAGLNLALGTIVIFNGNNYQVIQPHISQAGWSPSATPALFKLAHEPYGEWVQPLGAHDAYMMGDTVLHNGIKWRSELDHNVWEPGVHGWSLV